MGRILLKIKWVNYGRGGVRNNVILVSGVWFLIMCIFMLRL